MTDIRQALAQEQTKCPRCGEVNPAEIHTCSPQIAQGEQEPVAWMCENAVGYKYFRWKKPPNHFKSTPLYTAPPSKPEQWTPVEIGVDVTPEGAHVVGMYVLMPEAVRYVFYSQFHPAPKRGWVGLTDDEFKFIASKYLLNREAGLGYFQEEIEAKIKEKNT